MNEFQTYLLKSSIAIIVLLLCVALFNLLADPFELFNSPKYAYFNQNKSEYHTHVRMIKAHQVRRWKPEVIISGSSRAELGLNPDHPDLLHSKIGAYNLALSSANIYETLRYIQHSHSINPLKQVVIGLDFFMFNINKDNEPDFDESRLAPNIKGWYRDILNALVSYDGLTASLTTLFHQSEIPVSVYLPNGFKDDSHYWHKIQQKGGHHQAAINNESYTLSALDGFIFFSIKKNNLSSPSLDSFKKILIFCSSNNINLQLFISPEHARKLIQVNQIGLWQEFEEWKISLVKLIEKYAPEFVLWDFSGFNSITTEPFPPIKDNQTQMRWYWESSHYKKATGNIILHRMQTTENQPSNLYPTDFGMKLNSKTINRKLEQDRAQRDKYIKNNPEIIVEIKKMILKTEQKRANLLSRYKHLQPIEYFRMTPNQKL